VDWRTLYNESKAQEDAKKGRKQVRDKAKEKREKEKQRRDKEKDQVPLNVMWISVEHIV